MRKRIVVGAPIALAVVVALWVSLAHDGVSPIATPDQMFYLKRKLAHTTKIEIINRYPLKPEDGRPIVVTDKATIARFVDALLIHRMQEVVPADPPWIWLLFYSGSDEPFRISVCFGPHDRLMYDNPWGLWADIPPRLRRLLGLRPPARDHGHGSDYAPPWPPPGIRQ